MTTCHVTTPLRDGVYQVCTDQITACFVVRNGWIVECAPILTRRIDYWVLRAHWIST